MMELGLARVDDEVNTLFVLHISHFRASLMFTAAVKLALQTPKLLF